MPRHHNYKEYGTPYNLSPKQLRVVLLLVNGYTNKEIAKLLYIAESTVKLHVANILVQMEAGNRLEAAVRWVREQEIRSKSFTMGRTTVKKDDPGLEIVLPGGQRSAYLVMNEEERKRGFVRPVRFNYKHLRCGRMTSMTKEIAETYAANPHFYGSTFCYTCGEHFPVGESGEFVWEGTTEKVGT
jgi:DNA-binding CsgD family transcriptional regulator